MNRNNRQTDEDLFRNIKSELSLYGLYPGAKLQVKLENVEEIMRIAMKNLIGSHYCWLPEYAQIADWLIDTKGRGLLLYGNNGVGKTIMCRHIIPAIFLKCFRKVISYYDYFDINKKASEIMTKKLVAIDDIGNEEVASSYGNKHWVLPEIIDRAEKHNNLLIITTNLNGDDLLQKYGSRTYDRILATTCRVKIEHKSFRG